MVEYKNIVFRNIQWAVNTKFEFYIHCAKEKFSLYQIVRYYYYDNWYLCCCSVLLVWYRPTRWKEHYVLIGYMRAPVDIVSWNVILRLCNRLRTYKGWSRFFISEFQLTLYICKMSIIINFRLIKITSWFKIFTACRIHLIAYALKLLLYTFILVLVLFRNFN